MSTLQRLKDYFSTLGVEAAEVDPSTLTMPLEITIGRLQGILSLRGASKFLIFYAVSPLRVSPERRAAVAEYITRANYGLPVGNFEMDFNDGEVRFRVSLDYEDTALSDLQIKNLVQPAIHVMDQYMAGLVAVAEQQHEPQAAILQSESV